MTRVYDLGRQYPGILKGNNAKSSSTLVGLIIFTSLGLGREYLPVADTPNITLVPKELIYLARIGAHNRRLIVILFISRIVASMAGENRIVHGWHIDLLAENSLCQRQRERSEEHTSELQSLRHLVCR